jgi:hypothetical protein
MHQDIEFWWNENQRHCLWMKLDDLLMELATDPNSALMDRTAFMSRYNLHVQSYLDRTGPYEMPIYDEKEAQIRHAQIFELAGGEADKEIPHFKKEPFVFWLDMMHQELESAMFKVKCVQYGLKHAPQDFVRN